MRHLIISLAIYFSPSAIFAQRSEGQSFAEYYTQTDKLLHMGSGFIIGGAGAKEILIDDIMGLGTPDHGDFMATATAGAVGSLVEVGFVNYPPTPEAMVGLLRTTYIKKKLKSFAIQPVSLRTFFYCGVKEKKWNNVHHKIETAESGRYHAFGEARMYHFTEKWIYILGLPIWRTYFNCEDKGLYDPSPYEG